MNINTIDFYNYRPYPKTQFQNKFCGLPYKSMVIDAAGDVMLCNCQSYMPYVVGNIYQQSIKEIWNGQQAQIVRDSVAQSKFTYCSDTCSMLYNHLVDTPTIIPSVPEFPPEIKLDFDTSCNLKCPSCREHVIIEKNNQKISAQMQVLDSIIEYSKDQEIVLTPISSGEIFASHSVLAFLEKLKVNSQSGIRFNITSNGTLIHRNQQLVETLQPRINKWAISIDAASSDVYQKVRGGNWIDLVCGLDLLKAHGVKNLQFNFVIQKSNYHQIEQFAEWSNSYGARVHFQSLENWGHWNQDWWNNNRVNDTDIFDSLKNAVNKYGKRIAVPKSIAQMINQNTP